MPVLGVTVPRGPSYAGERHALSAYVGERLAVLAYAGERHAVPAYAGERHADQLAPPGLGPAEPGRHGAALTGIRRQAPHGPAGPLDVGRTDPALHCTALH
jgi:hypothetical protein